MGDILGLVQHHEDPPPPYRTELYELKCDTCGGRWPCDYLNWVRRAGIPPESVESNCLACDMGIVRWTGEVWSR
jgi:hypothetical protein